MGLTTDTTPNQLYKEARAARENNAARYRAQYMGREVRVTGRIRYISERGFGLVNTGRLAGGGGVWWGGEVQGNLDAAALQRLNRGDVVTVTGRLGEVHGPYHIVDLCDCAVLAPAQPAVVP